MLLYSQIWLLSKSLIVFMFTVEMNKCCYRTVTVPSFAIIILPLLLFFFFYPHTFLVKTFLLLLLFWPTSVFTFVTYHFYSYHNLVIYPTTFKMHLL